MTVRGRRARRRARPSGSALLAVLALAALTVLAPGATANESSARRALGLADTRVVAVAETPAVKVTITAVTPQVLRPGQDLAVRATVQNTGTTTISEPRLVVHRGYSTFISRSSLDVWRQADADEALGMRVTTLDVPAPLPPGASADVTAVLPSGSLGLRDDVRSWGARGLAVEVVDRADPGRRRLALARTFALWFPEHAVTATRLSVLVPVVGPATDPLGEPAAALEPLVRPGGRLAGVLAATGGDPDVTWVVDPWLLDAVTGATATSSSAPGSDDDAPAGTAGDDVSPGGSADAAAPLPGGAGDGPPTETGDTASTTAAAAPVPDAVERWALATSAAMTDRDVRLLPYLDADVGALAHLRAQEVFDAAVERSEARAGTAGLPVSAEVSLAWPADDVPDLATAAFVTADDDRPIVTGPGALPVPGTLTYTPTGRTTIPSDDGDLTVLVPDERLSTALRTGLVTGSTAGEPDDAVALTRDADWSVSPAVAVQDLLAELAVITRERPSDGRHLLATVPRDWEPDVDVVTAQLAAIAEAPWVRLEPVSALVGSPSPELDRGTLPERSVAPDEVSAAELTTVQAAVAERVRLAGMVERPDVLLDDVQAEVLGVTSIAWRDAPEARTDVVAASVARTQALRDAVSVLPGSVLNLISPTGELPVRVHNDLDQAVTVSVVLRPADPRLVADEAVLVTVGPGGEETVAVPVHAVQSADVAVAIELRTADGELVDDGTVITVRVRADWEGIGTAVLGALLAIGLVVGIIRTIRRGRTGRRAQPQLESGPDALSPEESAELGAATAGQAPPTDDRRATLPSGRPGTEVGR